MLLLVIIFKLLFKLQVWLDQLTKWLLGFSSTDGWVSIKQESESDFSKCAHVQKILWRSRGSDLQGINADNFLLLHNSFRDPIEAILNDDTVSLMFTEDGYAYFGRFFNEGLDIYSGSHGPFLYNVQFKKCQELISLPITFVPRLAQLLAPQDLPKKVILVTNTGRCGSTLLAKMLESIPGTVTLSEPDFLANFAINQTLNRDYLGPLLRLQIKGLGGKNVAIKPRSLAARVTGDLARQCPDVKHVFMWRDAEKNILSFLSLFDSVFPTNPVIKMVTKMMSHKPFVDMFFERIGTQEVCEDARLYIAQVGQEENIPLVVATTMWAIPMIIYKRLKGTAVKFYPVKYEDLLANPTEEMIKLVDHCELVDQLDLNGCLEAMNSDSQAGSTISKEKLMKSKKKGFDEKQKEIVNNLLQKMQLPNLENFSSQLFHCE